MSNNNNPVQAVFGQFAIEVDGKVKLYSTEAEAKAVVSEIMNGAKNRELAAQYCTAQGYQEKNAATKGNIIVGFLNWIDAGQPLAETEEVAEEVIEKTEEVVEKAEEAPTIADDDFDDAIDESFGSDDPIVF